jgi:hypothetical protein
MNSPFFDANLIKTSDCPSDFIPSDALIICGFDYSKDGDCAVKGFFDQKTGEYHIQEAAHNTKRKLLAGEAVKPSKENIRKPA